MSPANRIFISHATSDKPVAEALIDLFVVGLGLASEQIFCSSVEGHTIPPGVEFKDFMRVELTTGAAVVALISPAYLENIWCVCELGATWGLSKDFYPVLIPPVSYKSLPPFLSGTQALLVSEANHLDRMSDGLPKLFGKTFNVAKWNVKKDHFLKTLPKLLKSLPKQVRPTEQEIENLRKELQDYKAVVGELTEEKEQLSAKLTAVSKLKDKKETAKVLQTFTGESEQFKQLVANARSAISTLAWGTKEALFHWYRGDDFHPGYDFPYEDVATAVESGELAKAGPGEASYRVNEEKPRVRKATEALHELRAFAEQVTPEFYESFEQEYDDNFDVASRDFWSRFLKRT
jgi:hypothetical protein